MQVEIGAPGKKIEAEILLPASKSISNRVLIIRALSKSNFQIHNLSEANDTLELSNAFADANSEIYCGDGGTTLRFLLAYYACIGGEYTFSASKALSKRPIAELSDALTELGASIEYLNAEGMLPLKLKSAGLKGGTISISGETSSQFITALMLIGPMLKGGIQIQITGEVLSQSYILMTKAVMEYFSAEVIYEDQLIIVKEGTYQPREFTVEADWSAASYWYEIAALSESSEILLTGLHQNSLQGDAIIAELMKEFGVESEFSDKGVLIRKKGDVELPDYFSCDLISCPDLGPALAASCAGLNITADLNGLKNFRLKESDRAAAMQRELYNYNVKTDFCGGSRFKLYSGSGIKASKSVVNTYHDHRIAMAFAPLAIKTGTLLLDDEMVVAKSYPGYFSDLEKAGFKIVSVK